MDNGRSRGEFLRRFLLAILFIILVLILLVWVFPTKSYFNSLFQDVFRNNINSMRDAGEKYFTNERLPQEIGNHETITLREMLNKNLLLPFTDKNGNSCDVDKSYVKVTKNDTEYEMKVYLSCDEEEAYIIVYLGCTTYCENFDTCGCKVKTLYEYTKNDKVKEITGYSCEKGYTKDGKICYKNVSKTDTKKATPVYETKEETIAATPHTETKNVYKYLYEKTTEKTYSAWSDWSENKEYDPNNNNITFGKQELVWNEKNGSKKVTSTKTVYDKSQPIYETTYDNVIGSYKRYACTGYNYYMDTTTMTVYQYGDWTSQGTSTYSYMPESNDPNVKYIFKGMSYECNGDCIEAPKFLVEKRVRTVTKATTSTSNNLTVSCNVTEQSIPVYGKRKTFVGYVSDKKTTTSYVYYYHTKTRTVTKDSTTDAKWSDKENDQELIKKGYTYVKKEIDKTTTNTSYTCPTGYLLSDKTCYKKNSSNLKGYKCEAGYTLNNKTCEKTVTEKVTVNATPIYKEKEVTLYKWSEKDIDGWKKTGNKKSEKVCE